MPVRRPAGIPGRRSHCVSDFPHPAEVFKRRAEASPALALKLFQISARKSQVAWPHADPRQLLSVRGGVIQFLLSVSEPYGTEEGAGVRLTIRLTHQEVADFLASPGWWCPSAFKA